MLRAAFVGVVVTSSGVSEKTTAPTRDQLVSLCMDGIVAESTWHDRDSSGAQRQLGEALVLLRAGCTYHWSPNPASTDNTYWLRIESKGFGAFEDGVEFYDDDLFYIPTRARLDHTDGGDWY